MHVLQEKDCHKPGWHELGEGGKDELEKQVDSEQARCEGSASTELHRPGFYREEQCESICTFKR